MIRHHARWVLPISAPAIRDGTVCVEGARIAWVGPRADAPPGDDRDLGDVVLMPGLVNAHTHLELTVMRGFLEGLAFMPWILRLTSARREVLSMSDLLDSARLGIAEGLLAGVTTYADTCSSGVVHQAMREMGVRGVMYQEVFGPDPLQCAESMTGLRAAVERLRADDTALVRTGVSPHAPYSVSDALFGAVARYASDESLPIAVHVAESEAETLYVRDADGPWADSHRRRGMAIAPRGRSPITMLESAGVLAARALLIHCVRVDAHDIASIARHDCAVAHCPASNAKLGHGIAPVHALREAGVRVALGSDSVASNNRMDLLDEARLAILMQRAALGSYDALGAHAALALATLDGARALGMESRVGSLDVGKDADLAAFAIDDARATPHFDPADALIFAASGRSATFVAIAGEERVRDGRLVRDVTGTITNVREAAARLESWLAAQLP